MTRTGRKSLVVLSAWGLALAAVGAIARHGLAAQASGTERAPRIIETLNDCVQDRFKEVEERLGMARVIRPGAPHLFTPERMREITIVEELDHARMRVVLYLAGREVLKPKPDARFSPMYISEEYFSNLRLLMAPRPIKEEDAIEWGVIKGPIRVTPPERPKTESERPPATGELWEATRRAMQAFSRSETYDFGHGGWKFAARPIRVTDQACLNCHTPNGATLMSAGVRPDNTLRMGDAIGALLYGYKRMP